ncbi:MAG: hypothetical protein P9L92_18150, partial [Candidatus Electryonea clarkiae]|nr:hypothetical protein [Candidatus Electryonea clarkiae]
NRQTPLNKCSVLPMGRTALNKQNKNGNSNCRWREIIVDVEQTCVKTLKSNIHVPNNNIMRHNSPSTFPIKNMFKA